MNQPFRLSKSGPRFQAPEAANKCGVPRNEAPHREVDQNEVSQTERAQNGYSQNEGARIEVPQSKLAKTEAPQNKSARNEQAQNERAKIRNTEDTFTGSNSQPNGTGFFKLSVRTFSLPQLQKLSGDCFRLFLWMSSKAWRYLSADGTLRASIGYIAAATGMSHATISRSVKTLRDEGLIRLVENDYKKGNLWHVSPLAFGGPGDMPPQFELPQNGGTQKEVVDASKRGGSSLNLRPKPPQIEAENRVLETIEISQTGAEPLFDRIARIRAANKQKSERECLTKLLKTYAPKELEMAVSFLEKNGVLGTRQPCHSLFKYLLSAADDVIKAATKRCHVQPVGAVSCDLELEQSRQVGAAAVEAFENELSQAERESFTSRFIEKELSWGYVPSKSLLNRLVAFRWYSERNLPQQEVRVCG